MLRENLPTTGQIYQRENQTIYQIILIAKHSETGEDMVVYQAMFDDFQVNIKPLNLFMKEFDLKEQTKPVIEEKDLVDAFDTLNIIQEKTEVVTESSFEEGSVSTILLDFLDADTYQKKIEVLSCNRKHITDRMINDMAVSLDCMVEEGPIEERYQGLMSCLHAMSRFEGRRLR